MKKLRSKDALLNRVQREMKREREGEGEREGGEQEGNRGSHVRTAQGKKKPFLDRVSSTIQVYIHPRDGREWKWMDGWMDG